MHKRKELIIVGSGEFAEIAYEYFTHDSNYTVVAFSVEREFIKEQKTLFDLPIIPFEDLIEYYHPEHYEIFVAITYTQLNRVRTRLYNAAKAKGYRVTSYISSKAFIWHNVKIGENCFIFENNIIQYHVNIGNNVILWSGNHIGHRSKIGENCFISSHVVVSGYCEINDNCFLGVNSALADRIIVENDCIIGMGAIVTRNTEVGKIYKGNPAVSSKVTSYQYFNIVK